MIDNQPSKFSTSELKVILLYRKLNQVFKLTNKFRKRMKTKFVIIPLILLFGLGLSGVSYAYMNSTSNEKQGDELYKNGNYNSALDSYQQARHWWVFDKIFPQLRNKNIYQKIEDSRVMITSAEYFELGKKSLEEGNYISAKWYLTNLAKNDPKNKEASEMLKSLDKQIATKDLVKNTSTPILKPTTLAPSLVTNRAEPSPSTTSLWKTEPERHSTYPIIIKVKDSLGDYTTGSDGNGIPFFDTWPNPKPKVKIGQTLLITVQAEDPNGDQLQYRFKNNNNKTVQDWSSNSTYNWVVSDETGGNPFITADIKDTDGINRFGDIDDGTVLYYELATN